MSNTRVVLVTGGMGGLGETISTKMADAGYKVAVTYSPGNNKHAEWVAGMKGRGYDIAAVPCDVADLDSCAKAVAEVTAKVGPVDVLVNNAGITRDKPVVTYCRIGERSSHTWFVLKYLLGHEDVRNYDGSWTEWGNAVRVPIAVGTEPGSPPGSNSGSAQR